MAAEIRKRVVRVVINSGLLALIIVIFQLALPGALALIFLIPKEGLTITTSFILLLITIASFFALRILLDLLQLVDLISDHLIKHLPGFKSDKRISIKKALKEITIVSALILLTPLASSLLLRIPSVGYWLTIGLSITFVIISIILIYDAGKTLYAVFQSGIQLLLDKISA